MGRDQCMHTESLQSCPTLCDPIDCSSPGSSFHGILQTSILGGLPCPPPGNLSNPGVQLASLISPALPVQFCFFFFFTTNTTWVETKEAAKHPTMHWMLPPQQGTIQPKMSIALRLRNPALEDPIESELNLFFLGICWNQFHHLRIPESS